MGTSTPTQRALVILYDDNEPEEKAEAEELLNKLAEIVEHTPFDYLLIKDFPR